ncbi:MAG: YvcK family protein, partial [Desulfovibrio sp.]|nr:YvcK family protein [Desulfovibrio sp.]
MDNGVAAQPKILFFTGGSALRALATTLALENPNTVHVVTTFDSGGSTAELRRCLAIPALGDLRNRMLALLDRSQIHPKVLTFLTMRCGSDENQQLRQALTLYTKAEHPFWDGVPEETVHLFTQRLATILAILPANFNFHNACVGNLFLAQIFLEQHRDFGLFLTWL